MNNISPETRQFYDEITAPKTNLLGGMPVLKGHIQQLVIPLDVALPNANNLGEYELPGHRFWVDAKTTGIAQVFFDDPNAQIAGIPCVPGTVLKMPIETVYIVAPAQPGQVLVINWGDFDVIPPLAAAVAPGIGLSYGASYKSSTALTPANTAENIVANTSNVNGIDLFAAQYYIVAAGAGFGVLIAKQGAVAPASNLDGDVLFATTSSAAAAMSNRLESPVKITPGKRFDRISSVIETGTYAYALYTILQA
jgi:hypothetical protein